LGQLLSDSHCLFIKPKRVLPLARFPQGFGKLRRMAGSGPELPGFSFSFWLRRADANGGVPNAANTPVVPLD
jgi:hypothetical protein